MELPNAIQVALAPLFEQYPLDQALNQLVVSHPAPPRAVEAATAVTKHPLIAGFPPLASGVWMYVDELDRSHTVSQGIKDATGAFWHGIMHRREGDFSNAKYWFHRVGQHPAMERLDGYAPIDFIDRVAAARSSGAHNVEKLVAHQKEEWEALFTWCAQKSAAPE